MSKAVEELVLEAQGLLKRYEGATLSLENDSNKYKLELKEQLEASILRLQNEMKKLDVNETLGAIDNKAQEVITQLESRLETIIADIEEVRVISKPILNGVVTVANEVNFTYTASAVSHLADGNVASFDFYKPDGSKESILALNSKAEMSFIPTGEIGNKLALKVVAVDNLGNKSELTELEITITDNNLPVMTNFKHTLESELIGGKSYAFSLAGATDVDGDNITYKIETSANFAVSKITNILANEEISITTPTMTKNTNFEIAFIAVDSRGGETRQIETITIMEKEARGQILFDTVGTHSFVVPDRVFSICSVLVGAGQGGNRTWENNGGNGGALAYANGIPVTPGEILTIIVGAGGAQNSNGNNTILKRNSIILFEAEGGRAGSVRAIPKNGSISCKGGQGGISNNHCAGAGAGGYGDNENGSDACGGDAHYNSNSGSGVKGSASAGSGYSSSTYSFGGGGGVGLKGRSNSGASVQYDQGNIFIHYYGGKNGSDGDDGASNTNSSESINGRTYYSGCGGRFGGGGAGGGTSLSQNSNFCKGGNGGARIIWGDDRSYPLNAQDVKVEV